MNNFIVVVLIVLFLIFAPLLFIWSLNTLFPVLEIEYTLQTWFAALLVGGNIGGSTFKK